MPADLESQYFALLDSLLSARARFVAMRDAYRFRAYDNASTHAVRMGCTSKMKTLNGVIGRLDFMISHNRKEIVARWGEDAFPLNK